MKSLKAIILPILFLAFTLSSCEVVEGIFKVGFWAGIIVVALIVGIVIWIFRKMR